jgi:serine phosphatase RsbU (regulator of sigma subunit)
MSFGFVVLLKYVRDGFEKDIIRSLRTYTQQVAISLENMNLISEAIEKERYQEEIKISKQVQKSLLPNHSLSYDNLRISFFSKSATTVGGDFFDYCTSNGKQYWVAIGDVAGKGTAAAFLMAQLKGIFRSLVQVCSGPRNLVVRANHALAYLTEKRAFITFSVFLIDTEKMLLRHVRAGHCQGIYYRHDTDEIIPLEPKGMGLGILKDESFKSYIHEEMFEYKSGDALYLYTDGVTEAKNVNGEMLGLENLTNFIYENKSLEAETVVKNFGMYLKEFCANDEEFDDDITFLAVRFY